MSSMTKSAQKHPMLSIMVALNCEAKPWVDLYKLKKVINTPFELYAREGVEIEIVVTGIGASAMSTAIGWLAGINRQRSRAWLNLGIAGHAEKPLGELVRVHAFIDASDLKHYYPPLTAACKNQSEALLSVNAPTSTYPESAMVDMEGLAFYRSACMFSDSELIASLKVVSDNQENSFEGLNAAKITALMQPHTDAVDKLIKSLITLAKKPQLNDILLVLAHLRRSHSQQQQLERLLAKAAVLKLHDEISEDYFSEHKAIRDVLAELESKVNQTAPVLREYDGAQNG